MIYEIIITTYERQYTERMCGAIETRDRVNEIVKCDNVQAIEIIDIQTGAIMVEIVDSVVVWLDSDFTASIMNEIMNEIFPRN